MSEEHKQQLHDYLTKTREALIWKTEGLSEYDVRRPLTRTGTNLLGLVKHLSVGEALYFGRVFDRPFGLRSHTRTRRSARWDWTHPATCRGGRDLTSPGREQTT